MPVLADKLKRLKAQASHHKILRVGGVGEN
jgi:hypothetical protein